MDAGEGLLGTREKVGDVLRRRAELGAASTRLGAAWSRPEKTPEVCEPEERGTGGRRDAVAFWSHWGVAAGRVDLGGSTERRSTHWRGETDAGARQRRRRSGGDNSEQEGVKPKANGRKSTPRRKLN